MASERMTWFAWVRHWWWCKRNGICWRHLIRKEHGYNWRGCTVCAKEDKDKFERGLKTEEEIRDTKIREIRRLRDGE